MTISEEDLLNSIMASFDRIDYIKSCDIPNIDLYMDQVTTFMNEKMKHTARNPEEDKILTKTMINNYAKNNLLPPPVKKKYSKEHILVLIFIYYFKGILSIGDIQKMLNPITDNFFNNDEGIKISDIYDEVLTLEDNQIQILKEDVSAKFKISQNSFTDAPDETKDFLQQFSFVCMLSFDVYVKKLLIEKLIDQMNDTSKRKGNVKTKDKSVKEKNVREKTTREKTVSDSRK